jgi:hypothetical protein
VDKREQIKRIIWDYSISPEIFLDALQRGRTYKWITQEWALVRAMERLGYYDLLELVPLNLIVTKWPLIRDKVRMRHIKKGWDYVVRRHAVPAAGSVH